MFSEEPDIYDVLMRRANESDRFYGEKVEPVLKVLGILAGVEDFLDIGVELSIYGERPSVSLKSVTFVLGTGGDYISVYPNGLIEYGVGNVSLTDRELADLVYEYVEGVLREAGLKL